MAANIENKEAKAMGIYLNTKRRKDREPPCPTNPTISRVRQAAEMIASGKSDVSVRKWLTEEFHLADCTLDEYMCAVYRYLTPKDWNEEKERVITKNIKTLEQIVEKCMDKEQYKTAKEAIDSLNRIFGVTQQNAIVWNKNKEGDEQVIITFD